MTKYEYKVMNARNKEIKGIWKKPEDFENFLNQMGQQGWKLTEERDFAGVWTVIFRRKID